MGLLMRGDGTGSFEPVGPKQSGIIVPEQGLALAVFDFNHDNIPDYVMTINDGPVCVLKTKIRLEIENTCPLTSTPGAVIVGGGSQC